MNVSRLLLDLQELDRRLSEAADRVASIDRTVGRREALDEREEGVRRSRDRLRALESDRRDLDMTSQTAREKKAAVEGKLYGGSVVNPRELQDLNRESANLASQINGLDERMLDLLVQLEETQSELGEGEGLLERETEAWTREQESLKLERLELESELETLEGRRRETVKSLKSGEVVELYERVRRSKGHQTVARVERGLCRACGVSLPTHRVKQARLGREPVLCDSCGRILVAG